MKYKQGKILKVFYYNNNNNNNNNNNTIPYIRSKMLYILTN